MVQWHRSIFYLGFNFFLIALICLTSFKQLWPSPYPQNEWIWQEINKILIFLFIHSSRLLFAVCLVLYFFGSESVLLERCVLQRNLSQDYFLAINIQKRILNVSIVEVLKSMGGRAFLCLHLQWKIKKWIAGESSPLDTYVFISSANLVKIDAF